MITVAGLKTEEMAMAVSKDSQLVNASRYAGIQPPMARYFAKLSTKVQSN